MSNMIRGLKFTIKGGEGSGWFAPPKGTHVGEGASSGRGRSLAAMIEEAEEDVDLRRMKDWLRVAGGVPDNHLDGLKSITVDDDRIVGINEPGEITWAYHDSETHEIVIRHDATGNTLVHEIGHHVWNEKVGYWIERGIRREVAVGKAEWDSGQRGLMEMSGLREYSFSDEWEFFADSYLLWAQVKSEMIPAVDSYQRHYRMSFPTTASFLDSIFKE